MFEGEDIESEYKVLVLDYRIDLFFPKYRIAVEIDEYGYCDRDTDQ